MSPGVTTMNITVEETAVVLGSIVSAAGEEYCDETWILNRIAEDSRSQDRFQVNDSMLFRVPGTPHDLYLRISEETITLYYGCWFSEFKTDSPMAIGELSTILSGFLSGRYEVTIAQIPSVSLRWLHDAGGTPVGVSVGYNYPDLGSISAAELLSEMEEEEQLILHYRWSKDHRLFGDMLSGQHSPEHAEDENLFEKEDFLGALLDDERNGDYTPREFDLLMVIKDVFPWTVPWSVEQPPLQLQ